MNHLTAIGFGYTASALARQLDRHAWQVTATSRTPEGAAAIENGGHRAFVLNAETDAGELAAALHGATHILLSAAPTAAAGDPVLRRLAEIRTELTQLEWIGYLSTVGVYGGHNGDWVDETTKPNPSSERGRLRLAAETAWQSFGLDNGISVQVFRLSGIYGPGRSTFEKLRDGTARRIIKPGQVFNRMHVGDIAGAIKQALCTGETASGVFNIADDLPAPPQDVIAYAAELLGIEPPPEVPFDEADMTAMARSFYADNKRVSNLRMKTELGYVPKYPTYREGLQAIWQDGASR